MQYVEIYNESIKDLLNPKNGNLDVREAPGKGTYVAGAANVEVSNREDVELLLEAGNAYRTTESTQLNVVSSRSHAVLQLRCAVGGERKRGGKLSLIDLAGSERASKTGVMNAGGIGRGGTDNNSKRLNEGANINKSLLALANCISALADQAKHKGGSHAHVPYRDSKLTRLLKDSLGGACRTLSEWTFSYPHSNPHSKPVRHTWHSPRARTCVMCVCVIAGGSHILPNSKIRSLAVIANVSPASDQFDETLNTLKYADRAKRIRTKELKINKTSSRRRLLSPVKPAAGSAAAAAARRAAERSAASQLDGAKEAVTRHQERMAKGRDELARMRGLNENRNAAAAAAPGGGAAAGTTDLDEAVIKLQKLARGRLARTNTVRFKPGDLLGGVGGVEAAKRRNVLAKRQAAASAQMYDAALVRGPQRNASGGGVNAVRSRRAEPRSSGGPQLVPHPPSTKKPPSGGRIPSSSSATAQPEASPPLTKALFGSTLASDTQLGDLGQ